MNLPDYCPRCLHWMVQHTSAGCKMCRCDHSVQDEETNGG